MFQIVQLHNESGRSDIWRPVWTISRTG